MKLLREYIRTLLEVDLGDKVWATYAPDGSRHAGDEEDTSEEVKIWIGFNNWIMNGMASRLAPEEVQDMITQAAADPRYNDVFKFTEGGQLYRGMRLSGPWDIEKDYGVPDSTWQPALHGNTNPRKVKGVLKNMSPLIPASTEFTSIKRHKGLSSWSSDFNVAKKFASGVRDPQSNTEMGIILVADAGGSNKFIDLSGIYPFGKWGGHRNEQESVGVGPIQITGFYLIQPEKKKWWI